jgi:hypothetical protein
MPDALDTVDRIGRALGVLDGSENEDGQWFAECLRQWLAGAGWEGAVGLPDDWRGPFCGTGSRTPPWAVWRAAWGRFRAAGLRAMPWLPR